MVRAYEPDSAERHRHVPIQDTITRIPGYPRKLAIFKISASSYWWVRYYPDSQIFKRTTKKRRLNATPLKQPSVLSGGVMETQNIEGVQKCIWRRVRESNPRTKLCRLLPNHSANAPHTLKQNGKLFRASHRTWSGKGGSNSRPIPWQGIALPAELFPHNRATV